MGSASLARRRRAISIGMLALVAPLACQTNTGTVLDKKATQGAILGGLAGAGVGRAIGGHQHDVGGILIGTAAGALAGGLIGGYLDRQAEQVQDALPDATVKREGDRLLVTLPGDILFDSGAATLAPGGYERLRGFARSLNDYPDTEVVVKGYTDAQGSDSFNLKLSEDRADHVRKYLISEGVAANRLTAIGFGKQFPLASNATAEGRQQNRRVEFEIRPNQSLRDRDAQQGSSR